jgi:hypothetical protein
MRAMDSLIVFQGPRLALRPEPTGLRLTSFCDAKYDDARGPRSSALTAVPLEPGQMMTPDKGFLSRSHVARQRSPKEVGLAPTMALHSILFEGADDGNGVKLETHRQRR